MALPYVDTTSSRILTLALGCDEHIFPRLARIVIFVMAWHAIPLVLCIYEGSLFIPGIDIGLLED
jgi:hypothetical protein